MPNLAVAVCAFASGAMAVSCMYPAKFGVTVYNQWSAVRHPVDYPAGAVFSPTVLVAHNAKFSLWSRGAIASPGAVEVAQTGATDTIIEEIKAAQMAGYVYSYVVGGGGIGNGESAKLYIDVNYDFPYISAINMLFPSPDWFTGLNSVDLCQGGQWYSSMRYSNPYSAGSDSGVTFLSADAPIVPQIPIFVFTADTTTSAGVFVNSDGEVPPVAKWGLAGPAPMPPMANARKDPHFHMAHGGRTDIRGEDGAVYNVLSAKNVSFNVQMAAADFVWAKRTVHGTKMSKAFWTLRSPLTGEIVTVEVAAEKAEKGAYRATVVPEKKDAVTVSEASPFKTPGLEVSFFDRKLVVKTHQWEMGATINPFPFASLNKGKLLLDIEAQPLYNVDADVVAPHGIFGQSFDGDQLAVDGAIDTNRTSGSTTHANGEGAIEGTIDEYKMEGPFATEFKYSRFNAVTAPKRDVSKLTGLKRVKTAGAARASHAAPETEAVVA